MRKDGVRLKKEDPMYTVAAHIMDKRYDAMNMVEVDIDAEAIQNYINKKRNQGVQISHMAVILAAYVRMLGEFPEVNRFIVNKRLYARNEIAVGMVVLKSGERNHGTMSKMYFDYENTVFDVNNIINDFVNENRVNYADNGTEKMIRFLLGVPGLLTVGVKFFKFLDKHGLLPRSIIEASPFHNSLVISNLASIRTNHIYHHIYEFGTSSVCITMGKTKEIPKVVDGEIVLKKYMPLGVVMDERICSGSYFAYAFRCMEKYLKDPRLLETPPENPIIETPQVKHSKYYKNPTVSGK